MHSFTAALQQKGWKSKEVAERWGITPTRLSQIAAKPTRLHLDAVNGLPYKPSATEMGHKGKEHLSALAKLLGLDENKGK